MHMEQKNLKSFSMLNFPLIEYYAILTYQQVYNQRISKLPNGFEVRSKQLGYKGK